jgi:hypothetical protein
VLSFTVEVIGAGVAFTGGGAIVIAAPAARVASILFINILLNTRNYYRIQIMLYKSNKLIYFYIFYSIIDIE